MGKIKSITADVYVGDYGQMAESFEIILEIGRASCRERV